MPPSPEPSEVHPEALWAHWNAMVAVSYAIVRSREDAEDCAAEAMAQLLQRRPAGVLNMEAYAVTAAKNTAIDRMRRSTTARSRELRFATQAGFVIEDIAEDVARQHEARWVAEQAPRLLPAKTVAVLRQVADGIKIAEVADGLGITKRAAEGRLARGKAVMLVAWAKTLTILIGLTASARRFLRPASTTFALAVLSVLLVLLPSTTKDGSGVPPLPERPSAEISPLAAPRSPAPTATPADRPIEAGGVPPVNSGSPESRPEPRTIRTTLTVPVSRGGVVLTHEDDGSTSRNEVEALITCARDLQLTFEMIGC